MPCTAAATVAFVSGFGRDDGHRVATDEVDAELLVGRDDGEREHASRDRDQGARDARLGPRHELEVRVTDETHHLHFLDPALEHEVHQHSGHYERAEEGRQDADAEDDGEAAHWAGADTREDHTP
jgi:hypothetical protein